MSARADGSIWGLAASTSASSTRVRASAPSFTAFIASASSSRKPDEVAAADAPGLLLQARVAVGRDVQLRRDVAERLGDEQLARVGLEVAHDLAEVAAARGELRGREQRAARVLRPDGVERAEEQVGIGDPEHGEDVLGRDLARRST